LTIAQALLTLQVRGYGRPWNEGSACHGLRRCLLFSPAEGAGFLGEEEEEVEEEEEEEEVLLTTYNK